MSVDIAIKSLMGSAHANPYYGGIGSRETPEDILQLMTEAAAALEKRGFILRSGGADGADTAFENGVANTKMKQIFLPWKGYNKRSDGIIFHGEIMQKARDLASEHHPAWDRLKPSVQNLHARNMGQVLGPDLNTPSAFILAYTSDGKASGGTGQAIRTAQAYDVQTLNLYFPHVRQALMRELAIAPKTVSASQERSANAIAKPRQETGLGNLAAQFTRTRAYSQ